MSDQFHLSGDAVEEEVADALGESALAIDAEHPGFASLLAVMRGARDGVVEREVQMAYFRGLGAQIQEAEAALASVAVPDEIAEQMTPALQATRGMVGDMTEVLALFGDWLASDHVEHLDRAIAMLEAVHEEIRATANPQS